LFSPDKTQVQRLLKINRRFFVVIDQHKVVVVEQFAEFSSETLAVQQIAQAQTAPRDFILISRTYAAPGGADAGRAAGFFTGEVKAHVKRQYQRAGRA